MTDEELARDYVIKKHNIDMSKQPVDFSLDCEFGEEIEDFLAGHKEGKKGKNYFNKFVAKCKEVDELKEQKTLLTKRITELQADKDRLIDENSLARVLIDRCKELGIKDLYHLKDLLELVEVKKLEILELERKLNDSNEMCNKQALRITELEEELEKEKKLNKAIKERLVEVNCDCNAEKKEKCVMFPEYCEGERKVVVDLISLVNEGLNEQLLNQKGKQIKQLEEDILNKQDLITDYVFENEKLTKENEQLKAQVEILKKTWRAVATVLNVAQEELDKLE